MELHRNRWYVHWFFLSLAVCDTFADRYRRNNHEKGTNLCQFMRVTLVWAPLALALNVLVYGLMLAALTAAPIYFYGVGGYVSIVTAIALVVGIVILIGFLRRQSARAAANRPQRPVVETVSRPAKLNKGPSFGQVLWSYLVALKHRICPIITWNEA